MAKTEDLLDHSGEDECPVCRAFDLAYDVVIPALAAWENHYGLKEGQLGLATVLTAASALLEAELADREGLQAALAEYLDEAAAGLVKRPTAPGSETCNSAPPRRQTACPPAALLPAAALTTCQDPPRGCRGAKQLQAFEGADITRGLSGRLDGAGAVKP